jgi:hypothetical protein
MDVRQESAPVEIVRRTSLIQRRRLLLRLHNWVLNDMKPARDFLKDNFIFDGDRRGRWPDPWWKVSVGSR